MRMNTARARTWVFGAGTAAALAFGGAQAFAAPAAPAQEGVCNGRLCNRLCQTAGSIGGVCNDDGFCVCFL